MVEKMSVKQSNEVRSMLYDMTLGGLPYKSERIVKGALIHLDDGQFARLTISICDPTKFDLETAREEYAAKLEKQAALAAERAEKARIKAEKAAAKEAAKTDGE